MAATEIMLSDSLPLQPFPWQLDNWESLHSINRSSRLPHAILFTGSEGIGLQHFANCLVASLLCENLQEGALQSCGECRSCQLIEGKSHPDFVTVEPEEPGKQIKVDEIRNLIEFVQLKSHYGKYKISVITPAEAMNRSAANSLLKTLEEPPEASVIILLSHRPNLLPITIRSRCQQIKFAPAFGEATEDWIKANMEIGDNLAQLLQLSGGSPLMIPELHNADILEFQNQLITDLQELKNLNADGVKVAEQWKAAEPSYALYWLSQIFADMVRLKSLSKPLNISDSDLIVRLQALVKQLELHELTSFYHLLLENYNLSTGSISFNAQGLLETVIVSWQQLNET